jgi:hypothetical protein
MRVLLAAGCLRLGDAGERPGTRHDIRFRLLKRGLHVRQHDRTNSLRLPHSYQHGDERAPGISDKINLPGIEVIDKGTHIASMICRPVTV